MNKKIKLLLIIILCILFSAGIWAFFIEPNMLVIKKVDLSIPNWHKENNNLKIIVLADIHAGSPYIDINKLDKIVEMTNKEKPDVVLLLGDYVIRGLGNYIKPETTANRLGKIKSKHGIIAILGNHDWWDNGFEIIKELKKNNITVLENTAVKLSDNGKSFWIAGIADLWTREPDIKNTLKNITDNNPILLLTHSPDLFPDVPSRVSLTLAGHTHGGQVIIPLLGSVVVPSNYGQKYAKGHIIEDKKHLYVSSGIGTSIMPARFLNVPEILVLTLYRSNKIIDK